MMVRDITGIYVDERTCCCHGTALGVVRGSVGWWRTRRLSTSTCCYTSVRCWHRSADCPRSHTANWSDTGTMVVRLCVGIEPRIFAWLWVAVRPRRWSKLRNEGTAPHGTRPPLHASVVVKLSLTLQFPQRFRDTADFREQAEQATAGPYKPACSNFYVNCGDNQIRWGSVDDR